MTDGYYKQQLAGNTYVEKPEFSKFSTGGQKDTAEKLRMDLIPPEIDKAYAEVLGFGTEKYDDRNWERGIPFSQCIAAARRHLNAFQLGEDINEESSLHHMQHMLFWVAAINTYISRGRTDLDDRTGGKS